MNVLNLKLNLHEKLSKMKFFDKRSFINHKYNQEGGKSFG